jgi:predicted N-acetyltransferase YhbS
MQKGRLLIRSETPSDFSGTRSLHEIAFGRPAEGALVNALRENGDMVVSLVAMSDEHLIGHFALSRMEAPFRAVALGPVAVLPKKQGKGIGSRLIREGLIQAREQGYDGVFVVGEPAFYGQFGFSVEQACGLCLRVCCSQIAWGPTMDDDLEEMTREQLIAEVKRLRAGIRAHRDSSGHELCWHHPQLWGLLPEPISNDVKVPAWPQFLRGCVKYRESLDRELPDAPCIDAEFSEKPSKAGNA